MIFCCLSYFQFKHDVLEHSGLLIDVFRLMRVIIIPSQLLNYTRSVLSCELILQPVGLFIFLKGLERLKT